MYSVTREPMTESDRETLRRSVEQAKVSIWLPALFTLVGLLSVVFGFGYTTKSTVQDVRVFIAACAFVVGIVVLVFASLTFIGRFRHCRVHFEDRRHCEATIQQGTVEVVHFRADAAWRIPQDPVEDIGDQLNVVCRITSDTFVIAPLYEEALPGSDARVPAEMRVRRTLPPYPQPLTEFVPVGIETLPLSEDLGGLESLSLEWANDCHETATAGGKLHLKHLPASWRPIVAK